MEPESSILLLRREAAPETLASIAAAGGWRLHGEVQRAHQQTAVRLWKTPEGVEVGWSENHSLGVRWLWVKGSAALGETLRGQFPVHSEPELLAMAAGTDMPAALYALRVLSIIPNVTEQSVRPELLELLEQVASHQDLIVRRAALHVAWMLPHQELFPLAARRKLYDPELAEDWNKFLDALAKQ